jgi:endonuclease/exonuclease/phosphatase family metal-dependent hydrolase
MIRSLADEDFNFKIVAAVRSHAPDIDIVSVQEVHLSGQADPLVLAWAAQEGRAVLTHDNKTMPDFACERARESFANAWLIRGEETHSNPTGFGGNRSRSHLQP